jgi:hypothetical protein
MKPMSRLLGGIVVSLFGALIPVHAESQTGNVALRPEIHANSHANSQAGPQAWKKEPVHGREPAGTAPRGDLRGDIASNAHTRPDPDHGERPRRP